MQSQEEIQAFCRRYFQAVNATIHHDEPDYLEVELPREIDKELIERPWHWMVVETIYQEVPNTIKHLIFHPDVQREGVERTEYLTFGSQFLNKLLDSTQKRGSCTCGYQVEQTSAGGTLMPVLVTTCKLSLVSDRCRDEIVSYGVHLGSGNVYPDLYERIKGLTFAPHRPHHVQVQSPTLSWQRGYQQICAQIDREIREMDHTWALDAEEHLQAEREQLQTYYQSLGLVNADTQSPAEEKAAKAALYEEELRMRLEELEWRCSPKVKVEPFQFAVLYLDEALLV